ncbi:MAG: sialidase family protein [Kiritimatiellae bacterium]|nr:sialidase family protein [Kiritimatiellia bacterium]
MRLFINTILMICITQAVMLAASAAGVPAKLADVFEPVVVGHPPCDAFYGLVKLDSGELRHYRERGDYISSKDHGLTWNSVPLNGNREHWGITKSTLSGEYIRLATHKQAIYCARSKGGFFGGWIFEKVWPEPLIMLKPPVFIRNGQRILVGCHSTKHIGCGTLYSDDDGLTWKLSTLAVSPHHESGGLHHGRRWNHGAVEPTVVELKDGRIWMLIRTAQDNHYQSFSEDGGESWSKAEPSRFYGTITMPTINRLQDGRLLFLWNNTTPLPEVNNPDGVWEDVFTNRDALHAAISEDDGQTWIGFRELILNEDRNRSDFATCAKGDMSVHQTQIAELPAGKILVSLGQGISRRLLIFDPAWLYETKESLDFSNGLASVTTHQFLKGIQGHCAYNRIPGAELVKDPQLDKQVLKICNPMDDRLVIPNQGVLWNFPASGSGQLIVKIKFPEGSGGGRISLLDRWVNATDRWSHHYAMYNLNLDQSLTIGEHARFVAGQWHELRFEWRDVINGEGDRVACALYLDGKQISENLALSRKTGNGISYIHFIASDVKDTQGFMLESLSFGVCPMQSAVSGLVGP